MPYSQTSLQLLTAQHEVDVDDLSAARRPTSLEGREIDDLDEGIDSLKDFHSLRRGPVPEVVNFAWESQEGDVIIEKIQAWHDDVPAESTLSRSAHSAAA